MAQRLSIRTSNRSLTSLLQYIKQGSIQVPQFQRGFIWERDNVKKLFDSINKGYPVGTVFLWKPSDKSDSLTQSKLGAYTIPREGQQDYYVLDGYQRLSSLFSCLYNGDTESITCDSDMLSKYFSLYYDAKIDEFIYLSKRESPKYWQFPLNVMLVASDFRKYSREHLEVECDNEEEKEKTLDQADRFCSRLLDYSILCTEIENADINQAADIFSRINKEGTKVTIDWMVHALSYDKASGFNLAQTTDELLDSLQEFNFEDISRNAIFRCFQSSFDDKIYFDQDKIEKLARKENFRKVIVEESVPAIKKAVRFLYEELHVIDRKLLPYNSQLIFCMEFFRRIKTPTSEQTEWLKEWFWLTTYSSFFTNNSLADQRKEFSHFITSISKNDFSRPFTHFIFVKQWNLPYEFNIRGVRSRALALFVINNIFKECPENMSDAVFRQTFISPCQPIHSPLCTLFTDVESTAYNRLRNNSAYYYQESGSLFPYQINYNIETDKKILSASFFNVNDLDDLSGRKKRMLEEEIKFIRELGIILDE